MLSRREFIKTELNLKVNLNVQGSLLHCQGSRLHDLVDNFYGSITGKWVCELEEVR